MAVPLTGLEVRLVERVSGWPAVDDFAVVESPIPDLGAGEVLIRNTVMSVDPYLRNLIGDASAVQNQQLQGAAIGEVIATNSSTVQIGDVVSHMAGWRAFSVVEAAAVEAIDPAVGTPATQLGALGLTGLTAYAGMTSVLAVKHGETVFVSAAAGAVGSMAGQIAKQLGAGRVIGSAGSTEKVQRLTSQLGYDAAFNYRDGSVTAQLQTAAPEGIDVYFDNVGGGHLDAAIDVANEHARIALCGMISTYNDTTPPVGPKNMFTVLAKRLSLHGFSVMDHLDLKSAMVREVGGWLRDGLIRDEQTVVHGISNAPAAFIDMLRGVTVGKTLVTLD